MHGETGPLRGKFVAQGQRRDQVVAAVLPAERDRRSALQVIEAPAQLLAQRGETLRVDPAAAIDDERRQYLEAGVMQDAVVDGEQQVVHRSVDTARGVVRLPAAGGDYQHRPLALHPALAVAVAPVAVGMFADPVGEAAGIDAIDPTLEDRRHAEPPERELQDQRIGPAQLVLLTGDVDALPTVLEGAQGSCGRIEAFAGLALEAVAGIEHGLPAHRVEVRNLHRMAGRLEAGDREVLERTVEGARLGMGIDDEYVHGGSPAKGGRRIGHRRI